MNKKRVFQALGIVFVGSALWVYLWLRSYGVIPSPVYDTVRPDIPVLDHPAVLVLYKTNGFVHKEALPAATAMLDELALEHGWNLYQTDNAASHNGADLARFDAIVWNNTSGDILTTEQRKAFKAWIMNGGQWLGLHAAGGDPSYDWRWYMETFLGAQFIGHTMSPWLQDADVLKVEESKLTTHLPKRWRITHEEWYAFDRNPRETGATILMAMDDSSYETAESWLGPDVSMPGEHPIAWSRAIGEGRMIYSAIGHTAETYALPEYRKFVANGINAMIQAHK
jgi:type 1 glutamine amidotransferase